jgi:hypothetical protein
MRKFKIKSQNQGFFGQVGHFNNNRHLSVSSYLGFFPSDTLSEERKRIMPQIKSFKCENNKLSVEVECELPEFKEPTEQDLQIISCRVADVNNSPIDFGFSVKVGCEFGGQR